MQTMAAIRYAAELPVDASAFNLAGEDNLYLWFGRVVNHLKEPNTGAMLKGLFDKNMKHAIKERFKPVLGRISQPVSEKDDADAKRSAIELGRPNAPQERQRAANARAAASIGT